MRGSTARKLMVGLLVLFLVGSLAAPAYALCGIGTFLFLVAPCPQICYYYACDDGFIYTLYCEEAYCVA